MMNQNSTSQKQIELDWNAMSMIHQDLHWVQRLLFAEPQKACLDMSESVYLLSESFEKNVFSKIFLISHGALLVHLTIRDAGHDVPYQDVDLFQQFPVPVLNMRFFALKIRLEVGLLNQWHSCIHLARYALRKLYHFLGRKCHRC